jgi:hypothetical protein
MRSPTGAYPRDAPPWCAAPPDRARQCSRWSSWSRASFNTVSLACSWRLRRQTGISLKMWHRSVDLEQLQLEGKLAIDCVAIERSRIEETGEYTLDRLFAG